MSVKVWTEIDCDLCGDSYRERGQVDYVRRVAARLGWSFRDDAFRDLCPDCTRKQSGRVSKGEGTTGN